MMRLVLLLSLFAASCALPERTNPLDPSSSNRAGAAHFVVERTNSGMRDLRYLHARDGIVYAKGGTTNGKLFRYREDGELLNSVDTGFTFGNEPFAFAIYNGSPVTAYIHNNGNNWTLQPYSETFSPFSVKANYQTNMLWYLNHQGLFTNEVYLERLANSTIFVLRTANNSWAINPANYPVDFGLKVFGVEIYRYYSLSQNGSPLQIRADVYNSSGGLLRTETLNGLTGAYPASTSAVVQHLRFSSSGAIFRVSSGTTRFYRWQAGSSTAEGLILEPEPGDSATALAVDETTGKLVVQTANGLLVYKPTGK